MKKRIFLLSTMLISIISFSQEIFNSKYTQICEFNYKLDDYEILEEVWMDVKLTAYEDYCIILSEGEEEEKMWWEVSEEESDGNFIVFYTEDQEDKIIFDGDEEQILIFFEYNGRKDRYDALVILSKIE
tara:strand:+ start:77 stop:463 length:387 start_codon:yes stop_codon:yes gene_type:complete